MMMRRSSGQTSSLVAADLSPFVRSHRHTHTHNNNTNDQGETVSIVFFTDSWRPDSFYDKIASNRRCGLHTLCLLDIKVKEPNLEALCRGRTVYEPPRCARGAALVLLRVLCVLCVLCDGYFLGGGAAAAGDSRVC